jgi:hypothetical protein
MTDSIGGGGDTGNDCDCGVCGGGGGAIILSRSSSSSLMLLL